MEMLKDKKILLIITGSIAAYKSAYLCRMLIKAGADVRIVMTPAGAHFITPLTLSTLSRNEVLIDMMKDETWNSHVDLGLWADLVLIAPATANTMAKMVAGIADNLALTTCLSAKCPLMLAPAMDLDMWKHPITQKNVKSLYSLGYHFIEVGSGELASGLRGEGRMAEPEDIVKEVVDFFSKKKVNKDLVGKKVLLTAGPTYESIDPVRFIGNHSSGKMGLALANEAYQRGAEVTLVIGPNHLDIPSAIHCVPVRSAKQMGDAVDNFSDEADIIIMAAAVADFTPISVSNKKIKKKEGNLQLELKRTRDIAMTLGARKKPDQIIVGFALETNDAIQNASRKLEKKNFDFIVLNSLADPGAGFKHDTNKITIIGRGNKMEAFELKSKTQVAVDIINTIVTLEKS